MPFIMSHGFLYLFCLSIVQKVPQFIFRMYNWYRSTKCHVIFLTLDEKRFVTDTTRRCASPTSYNLYNPYQQYSNRDHSLNPYQSFGSYQSSAVDFKSSYEPKLSRYSSPPVLDGQFTNQGWPATSFSGNSGPVSYDHNQYSSGISHSYEPGIAQNESPQILSGQFIDYQDTSLNVQQTYNRNPPIRYLLDFFIKLHKKIFIK